MWWLIVNHSNESTQAIIFFLYHHGKLWLRSQITFKWTVGAKSLRKKYSGTRSRQACHIDNARVPDCGNKEHKWNYHPIVFFIFSSGFFRYCTNQLQHNLNCPHMKQCPIWDESHWCGYIRNSRWVQEPSYYFYIRKTAMAFWRTYHIFFTFSAFLSFSCTFAEFAKGSKVV